MQQAQAGQQPQILTPEEAIQETSRLPDL
jgi:hypothetical protein